MGKVHRHDGIAVFEESEISGHVRLRAAVGLHVSVFGVIKLFGAPDGYLFYGVHIFAAAVIAVAGIAFRVFIGEERALRFQHRFAGVVLRRYKVDGIPDPLFIAFYDGV